MASFRIIKMPRGQAPDQVRAEWVGVELPLEQTFKPGKGVHERNFDLERQEDREFVSTPVCVALEELEKKSSDAALWFYNNLPQSFLEGYFTFGADEVEIID